MRSLLVGLVGVFVGAVGGGWVGYRAAGGGRVASAVSSFKEEARVLEGAAGTMETCAVWRDVIKEGGFYRRWQYSDAKLAWLGIAFDLRDVEFTEAVAAMERAGRAFRERAALGPDSGCKYE